MAELEISTDQNQAENQSVGSHFVAFLKSELNTRVQNNSRYSLRAYAKLLGVSPSYLSMLFNRKRILTEKMLLKFCECLALSPQEVAKQQLRLKLEKGDSESSVKGFGSYSQLSQEKFATVSEWSHFAILEILRLKTFSPSTKWIAGALNISEFQVSDAIDRLKNVGMLKVDEEGHWSCVGSFTGLDKSYKNAAARNLQKQILEQSLEAIDNIPLELRDHTSMTMSVHKNRLPEALKLIKKFRREICDFMEKGEDPDEVYQLQVSLFPITDVSRQNSKFQ